jgi:trehalose-phosphatase
MRSILPKPDSTIFNRIRQADRRLLMLDYDGVLAPFHIQRLDAVPYHWTIELIRKLSEGTEVSIVSGRPLKELKLLLPDLHVRLFGSHGWEFNYLNGHEDALEPPTKSKRGLELGLYAANRDGLNARLEIKRASIALHWRNCTHPDALKLQQWAYLMWGPITQNYELQLLDFNGGIELRCKAISKGTVVKWLLNEKSNAFSAYLGDDVTDEDAFDEISDKGIGILVSPESRQTKASCQLRSSDQVREFLESWVESQSRGCAN